MSDNRNNDHGLRPWKCPTCEEVVTCFPALSRLDNHTEICSACGSGEAFHDAIASTDDPTLRSLLIVEHLTKEGER